MKNKFEQHEKSAGAKRESTPGEYKNDLVRLAEQIILEDDLNIVEVLLDSGDAKDVQEARKLLLLAVDKRMLRGKTLDEEARYFYKIIGFSPEEASRIRQQELTGE